MDFFFAVFFAVFCTLIYYCKEENTKMSLQNRIKNAAENK
jgi:hypothetical protein